MLHWINFKQALTLTVFLLLRVFACSFGTIYGGFDIGLSRILSGELEKLETEILLNIRGPRITLAVMVGAALGVSGAALQGLFRNPLADPGLIGVSAGAALGAVSAIVFLNVELLPFQLGKYLIPLAAILSSCVVICVIFILTNGFKKSDITYVLLIGIALNALATVGIGLLTFISTDSQLRGLTYWMMGSFGAASWSLLVPAFFIVVLSILTLIFIARKLDIMQLGEVEAYRLGVEVKKLKMMVILISALMVGISVSLSGIIGFVGLVVPHLVRLIAGTNHTYLFAGSALLGITITVSADLLSRMAISPAELPVGLTTSALGAPFFLFLVMRLRKIEY